VLKAETQTQKALRTDVESREIIKSREYREQRTENAKKVNARHRDRRATRVQQLAVNAACMVDASAG
jgi:hypothetical protein